MPNPAFADSIALAHLNINNVSSARVDGRVMAHGNVHVKVLYSTLRLHNPYFKWQLSRPIVCDVLMLIAEDKGKWRFFLFDPDDDCFYYADGRQKQSVTWYDDRVAQRHHEQRYEALTSPVMGQARDRWGLIEDVRCEHALKLPTEPFPHRRWRGDTTS